MALGTKIVSPGGHQGHGQFSIDTYSLEVLDKTQVSDPGSFGPLFCVSILDIILCCFYLNCLLYARYFLNMAIPIYTSNSNTCISRNIPGYQNV